MLVLMGMIVTAFRVIVVVVMMVVVMMVVVAAAFFVGVIVLVLVTVVMAAAAIVAVIMVMVAVRVIVTFTADVLSIHREQIEEREHGEADASSDDHRAEDTIRRQVKRDASGNVEKEHHAAPEQERGDAEEVDECASA